MATTQATKQVARSAAHALPQRANNVQLRAKVRTAALIDSMHRQLYPDLYKANGKMKDAEAERDNERRSKRQMTPQPAFAEDVKKYEGYTDPRIENAGMSFDLVRML